MDRFCFSEVITSSGEDDERLLPGAAIAANPDHVRFLYTLADIGYEYGCGELRDAASRVLKWVLWFYVIFIMHFLLLPIHCHSNVSNKFHRLYHCISRFVFFPLFTLLSSIPARVGKFLGTLH